MFKGVAKAVRATSVTCIELKAAIITASSEACSAWCICRRELLCCSWDRVQVIRLVCRRARGQSLLVFTGAFFNLPEC